MTTPRTHARSADNEARHTSTTVTAASVAVLVAVTLLALSSWLLGPPDDTVDTDAADPVASARTHGDDTTAAEGDDSVDPAAPAGEAALEVLRTWDAARAAAWAAGDGAALADLYVAGSAAGERDVARLRRWTERGLRVEGMRMQLLRVDVRRHTAHRLVLRVTDRLTGAVAVRTSDGRTWDLPTDRSDTRRLVFRRAAGRWRLASSYDRPLASMAVTSRSAIS